MAAKDEILTKLNSIIQKAKRIHATGYQIDKEADEIMRELDEIEKHLANMIDEYMARKIHKHIYRQK